MNRVRFLLRRTIKMRFIISKKSGLNEKKSERKKVHVIGSGVKSPAATNQKNVKQMKEEK